MTLTVKLDEEDRHRLDVLITVLNVSNQSEVVRKLINERYEQLKSEKTLAERRGGHPVHLLEGPINLSSREARKRAVTDALDAKRARRRSK